MSAQSQFITGSIFALTAVVLGAFGAHILEELLDAERLVSFQTGVRYQFYHSFALFLTGILLVLFARKTFGLAAWFFAAGNLLFSGSIYLLSCRTLLGIESWTWLGPITPIGGLSYMVGWILVGSAFLSQKKLGK